MRIALKYCGSCNPEIDLSRVGNLVVEQAQRLGWEVVPLGQGAEADVLVLLCGCPRTCIDKEGVRQAARQTILVAGKRLGWQPVTEGELPAKLMEVVW